MHLKGLKNHKRSVHEVEKTPQYKCELCENSFNRRAFLLKHKGKVTRGFYFKFFWGIFKSHINSRSLISSEARQAERLLGIWMPFASEHFRITLTTSLCPHWQANIIPVHPQTSLALKSMFPSE